MALSVGIGFNNDKNSNLAAAAAIEQAKRKVHVNRIDLILVLATPHYSPENIIQAIGDRLDSPRVIGCSTEAIIIDRVIHKRGVAVALFHSNQMKFETGSVQHLNLQNPQQAAESLIHSCKSEYGEKERRLFFVFTEGAPNNIPAIHHHLRKELKNEPEMPILGSSATNMVAPDSSFLFHNNETVKKAATVFVLGGKATVKTVTRHGWHPIGRPRFVDKSSHHIIHSIDGRPAIELYKTFFPEQYHLLKDPSSSLNLYYPLGIASGKRGTFFIRNIIDVLDDGSIVCNDNVDSGSQVHIMLGNKDSCLQVTKEAIQEFKGFFSDQPTGLALVIVSEKHHRILGRSFERELAFVKRATGENIPVFGFVSYGEIFDTGDACQQTLNSRQNNNLTLIGIK